MIIKKLGLYQEICMFKERMTNSPKQSPQRPSCSGRSKMAWGGPTLKGSQGLNLESISDKHMRNKCISFSVVTVVDIIRAPLMSDGEQYR